jgi:hypothetical protein
MLRGATAWLAIAFGVVGPRPQCARCIRFLPLLRRTITVPPSPLFEWPAWYPADCSPASNDRACKSAADPTTIVAPSTNPRQRDRENVVHIRLNHHDFVTVR